MDIRIDIKICKVVKIIKKDILFRTIHNNNNKKNIQT